MLELTYRPPSRWERRRPMWPLWLAALIVPAAMHANVPLTILPVLAVLVVQIAVHRWRRQQAQHRWDDQFRDEIAMMRYQAELNADAIQQRWTRGAVPCGNVDHL